MAKILNVLLTCRDRFWMTQKTIESLHENSTVFDKIHIHCYDNLSDISNNRFELFSNLLKDKKIIRYSYDTEESLNNCFGKAVAYYHWINQIKLDREINKHKKDMHFFLLIDNDMLVGPKWDQYFISAALPKNPSYSCVFYCVKYPGGIPSGARESERRENISNIFDPKEKFEVAYAFGGGGSGFWFMGTDMITKHRWGIPEVLKTYDKFKKHDTTMWEVINRQFSTNRVRYVAGVIPPNPEENPLVIHLGPIVGSMCNSLTNKTYSEKRSMFEESEYELIKNYSVSELFERYKIKCQIW